MSKVPNGKGQTERAGLKPAKAKPDNRTATKDFKGSVSAPKGTYFRDQKY